MMPSLRLTCLLFCRYRPFFQNRRLRSVARSFPLKRPYNELMLKKPTSRYLRPWSELQQPGAWPRRGGKYEHAWVTSDSPLMLVQLIVIPSVRTFICDGVFSVRMPKACLQPSSLYLNEVV